MIAAFVGDEQRGVGCASEVPVFLGGGYAFLMMVYSNATGGEMLTFQYYSSNTDEVLELAETIEFETNMVEGDATDSFVLTLGGGTVELLFNVTSGWNWMSVNATGEDMGVNNVFASAPFAQGDYIKSQTQDATYYDGYGFYGSLEQVDPTQTYLLKLGSSSSFTYEGVSIDVENTPVDVSAGWNWVGYLPPNSMPISTAFVNASFAQGDYIKSQTQDATFYDGYGFYGSLEQMHPLTGYLVKVGNDGSFYYSSGSLAAFINETIDDDLYYKQYEFNGSIRSTINITNVNIDENDILYAYSNGELRGKTTPVEFPLTGELVFSLMVYGDGLNQEVLNFELYDYETNNYYPIEQKLNFSKDMIVGDALDPFYFEGESTTPSEFKLFPAYPNPFNPSTTITYSISEPEIVKLSVYDITGREVEILENNHKDSGSHTMLWDAAGFASGIYYIQLTAGNQIETQKVMLVK